MELLLARQHPRLARTEDHWERKSEIERERERAIIDREVLHGVGADGVGVKFPIFAVNCCCLPLFPRRRGKMRRKRGKMRKKGEKCAKKG